MDRLYAGWRVRESNELASDGLVHANLLPKDGLSLFETIEQSGLPDERTYVVHRGEKVFSLMNIFPYAPGHVMVLPKRAAPTIGDLTDEEYTQLWAMVKKVREVVLAAFRPHGLNIGLNEGSAGGGSQPDHVHVHVVPRWSLDTSFMTTVGNARVLPFTLADSWEKLRKNWPLDV